MYLLFFSKYCKYSAKFMDLVKKIHYESYFQMVSVDKVNGARHPFVSKYNVREVPAIIVNQRVYTGKEAFKWLQSKIKNANTSVPTQSVRQNKIPHISGFTPESSSMGFADNDNFDGTSQYCSLKVNPRISTPAESENVEKSQFVLPQDTITGNLKTEDTKNNGREDAMKQQFEKLALERKQQDSFFKTQYRPVY